MKNGSQELILLKKEFDTGPHFALSHYWQSCNYSRTNKAIFKFIWNFQETCETNFFYREWGRLSWPELWISTKTLKPKAGESLISNVIKKYYGKHVTKKIFLRKCHFAFILHFALATQGYIREKGIFQAGMILFTNYYHKALHLRCCSSPRSVCGTSRG